MKKEKVIRLIEISRSEGGDTVHIPTLSGGDYYEVKDFSTENTEIVIIALPRNSAFFQEGRIPDEQMLIELSIVSGEVVIKSGPISKKITESIVDEIIESVKENSSAMDFSFSSMYDTNKENTLSKNVTNKNVIEESKEAGFSTLSDVKRLSDIDKLSDINNDGRFRAGNSRAGDSLNESRSFSETDEEARLKESYRQRSTFQSGVSAVAGNNSVVAGNKNSVAGYTDEDIDFTQLRLTLIKEAENKCQYCRRHLDEQQLEIDHFLPLRRYPELKSDTSNLVVSCKSCNMLKSDYDPSEEGKEIFNPNTWEFQKNFDVLRETGEIKPITDIAKRLVDLLNINSHPFMEHRKMYYQIMDDVNLEDPWTKWENWLSSKRQAQVKKVHSYITGNHFLYDNLSEEDFIGGRKEFAKVLATKVTDIFEEGHHKGSFMLHLQGRWGSGKSTFMNYFETELASSQKWMIVNFDAWRYQHFIPTWWGFLEQIKMGILKKHSSMWDRFCLNSHLYFYRFKKVLGIPFFIGVVSLVLFLLSFVKVDSICFLNTDFLDVIKSSTAMNWIRGGLGGVTFLTFIKPFKEFYNSSVFLNARKIKSYVDSPSMDPYEIASEYYSTLVNKGRGEKNLAVFIDDLDRCKPENAVKLLEGIQTLFKNKELNVFYLISADKLWLKNCFEEEYKEMKSNLKGISIGLNFLEKFFQVSVRLPNTNLKTDESLIDKIVGINVEKVDSKETSQNTQESNLIVESSEKDRISEKDNNIANRDSIEKKTNQASIPSKDEIVLEETHLLTELHPYLGPNPRVLKRVLNSYEINRYIITIEQSDKVLDDDQLLSIMKCTILEERLPEIMMAIEKRAKTMDLDNDEYIVSYDQLSIDKNVLNESLKDNSLKHLLESIENEEILLYFGIKHKSFLDHMYGD